MNLQTVHLPVVEYLYRGRRAVPMQTFTTRYSNRKLSNGYNFVKHFYAMRPVKIMQKGPFCRSRSFKVTDFGTNRKLIYGFLYQDDSYASTAH